MRMSNTNQDDSLAQCADGLRADLFLYMCSVCFVWRVALPSQVLLHIFRSLLLDKGAGQGRRGKARAREDQGQTGKSERSKCACTSELA